MLVIITIILTKKGGSDKTGFYFMLTDLVKTQFQNEGLTWSIDVKASRSMTLNTVGFETNGKKQVNITTTWNRISHTFINKFTNYYAFVFYNPTTDFNNGDKIYLRLPKLEKGNIATDWTPAPEDDQQSINDLNSWKQTATETLNTVSSGLNDTVKHSQLRIGADGIDFGSNKVFNGRNLASILSVSPESIQAITDRLVISPTNENLVLPEHRDTFILNVRNGVLNKIYGSNTDLEGEYYFKLAIVGFDTPTLYASIRVTYTDGKEEWFNSEFPTHNLVSLETSTSVKVQVKSAKNIKYIEPLVYQNKWSDFYRFHLKNLFVGKKKSAELIVDGSIEGRQIKTQTLETGHHKAGSITSEIIAAKAVKVNNLLVDDAMIDEFVAHKAFISKLWAQDAFIKNLSTVKISATQLDTDWLSAYTGDIGGFRIGKNPNQPGDFWLTGSNNFNCGLNPGHNIGTRGAQIWAAWGNRWDKAGNNAWWVDGQGVMHCYNRPILSKGLDVSGGNINMHGSNIEGYADENRNKTTVIWWSQINKVKSSVSDKRFKTNIKPTKIKAVDLLNKIEMVEFNWKKDNKFEKIGAIAQQVQSVEESLVVYDMDDKQTYNDYLRINYYDTIPYLIKAVQELSEENNKLKNKLEELING